MNFFVISNDMLWVFLFLISTMFGLRVETPELVAHHQGSALFPKVSIDRRGNKFIVWQECIKGGPHIFFSKRAPNDIWEAPICLSKGSCPHMQIDGTGQIYLVWQNGPGIEFCFRSISDSWSPHEIIATPASIYSLLKFATNQRGDIAVLWKESGSIYSIFHPFKGAWSTAHLVAQEVDTADLVLNSLGNAIIIWKENQKGIKTADWNQENWSAPQLLSDPGTENNEPQLIIDDNNQVTAFWITHSDGSSTIQAASRTDGNWSPSQIIAQGLQRASKLSVCQDKNRNIAAVWMENQDKKGKVKAVFKDRAEGRLTFLSSCEKHAESPCVAIDESGVAIATWLESDGRAYSINISSCIPSTEWSLPMQLTSAQHIVFPRLALLGDSILISWSQIGLGKYWVHTSQVFK